MHPGASATFLAFCLAPSVCILVLPLGLRFALGTQLLRCTDEVSRPSVLSLQPAARGG